VDGRRNCEIVAKWTTSLSILFLCLAAPTQAAVNAAKVDDLKAQFNEDKNDYRVIALVSPTCPMCRRGHRIVQVAFKKLDNQNLRGYVVWLPLFRADNSLACDAEAAAAHEDNRISLWWNERKDIGKAFAKTLGLHRTAMDVYAVYGPGKIWDRAVPPKPDFWMHQLGSNSGVDQSAFLNQGVFEERLSKFVHHPDKATSSN
jgi:hypothetical protein